MRLVLGGKVQEAETLSAAHRSRLKAALAALRAQADAIEAALKEGCGAGKGRTEPPFLSKGESTLSDRRTLRFIEDRICALRSGPAARGSPEVDELQVLLH